MKRKGFVKWLLCGVGIACAAAGILTGWKLYRNSRIPEETGEDGGVSYRSEGTDAPKKIGSAEITAFSCVFSTFAFEESEGLGNRVYELNASVHGDGVQGNFCSRSRDGEEEAHTFVADSSFMTRLQEIAAEYDFAAHNGFRHTVNGLPDMYGAGLDIRYASGETVSAYDNQDCFLPPDAMRELVVLFSPGAEEF